MKLENVYETYDVLVIIILTWNNIKVTAGKNIELIILMLPGEINAKMINLIFFFSLFFSLPLTSVRLEKHVFIYRRFVHIQTASKDTERIHSDKLNLVQWAL